MEIFTVLLIQKYYIVDGTENAAWGIALKIIFIYTFCFMCMCGLVSGSKRKIQTEGVCEQGAKENIWK